MLRAPCFDTDKRNRKKIELWVRRLRASRIANARAFQPVKDFGNQDVGALERGIAVRAVVSEKAGDIRWHKKSQEP